jgi:hypothetical protein
MGEVSSVPVDSVLVPWGRFSSGVDWSRVSFICISSVELREMAGSRENWFMISCRGKSERR